MWSPRRYCRIFPHFQVCFPFPLSWPCWATKTPGHPGLLLFFPSSIGDARRMLGLLSPWTPTPPVSCIPAVLALLPGWCQAFGYTRSCSMLSYVQRVHASKTWLLPHLPYLLLLCSCLCSYWEVRNMTGPYWAILFFPSAPEQFLWIFPSHVLQDSGS